MKRFDLAIPYSLRKLVEDKNIQNMIAELNEKKDEKGGISIYFPLANSCMNRIALNPNLYEEGFDSCFKLNDSLLVNELIRMKILSKSSDCYGWDDDTSSVYGLVIEKPNYIKHLYEWAREINTILNYGIFSIHTFTGEAYCEDSEYTFHTSKGLFVVFKAFLAEPTHILSYKQIYDLFQKSNKVKVDYYKEAVHQIIGEIREKLNMKGSKSKLFLPSDNKYFLRPF